MNGLEDDILFSDKENNPWYPEPYQKTIELHDGTVLNGSAALNEVDDDVWVWLDPGLTIPEAVIIFSDKNRTERIISHTSEISVLEFDGYTRMVNVRIDINGKITICMKK